MQDNSPLADSPRFSAHFLHPKYLGNWVLFALLWLIRFLPRRVVMALGTFVGEQMYKRNAKRRKIAQINLSWCFPQFSSTQIEQLLRHHYHVFGATIVDLGTIWWSSEKRLRKIILCPLEEQYRQLVANKNVILFTPHVVAIDAGGIVISRNGKGITMMKRDRNALVTWQLYRARRRFNGAIIVMRDQGLKSLLRGVKEGRPLYYMPDEDFGDAKFTEFAPFFGVQTSTITMLGRLAKFTNAICVPCSTALDIKTGIYTFRFGEALPNYPSDDVQADVAAMNAAMEALLRETPEQYMWTFKWFKTRPNGQTPPY